MSTARFKGLIDDVRIYAAPLSQAAIVRASKTPAYSGDRDGDGMPGAWESLHGLDPDDARDGEEDNDGDGQSNRAEFGARTDPNNATSSLRVLDVRTDNRRVTITWSSVDGLSYAIDVSPDLSPESWVEKATVTANGRTTQATVSVVGESVFTRVRVLTR